MGISDFRFKLPPAIEGGSTKWTFQDLGRIRYNGLVHIGDLLSTLKGWFDKHKYVFNERIVKHKFGSGGLEKEYEWRPKKKVNEYLEYETRVIFKIKDIVDVEVIRDGKKDKLQQCVLLIQITGILKYDPYKRAEGGGMIAQNLRTIYHRLMKKEIITKWQDDYENHLKDLQKFIHQYLEYESTITL